MENSIHAPGGTGGTGDTGDGGGTGNNRGNHRGNNRGRYRGGGGRPDSRGTRGGGRSRGTSHDRPSSAPHPFASQPSNQNDRRPSGSGPFRGVNNDRRPSQQEPYRGITATPSSPYGPTSVLSEPVINHGMREPRLVPPTILDGLRTSGVLELASRHYQGIRATRPIEAGRAHLGHRNPDVIGIIRIYQAEDGIAELRDLNGLSPAAQAVFDAIAAARTDRQAYQREFIRPIGVLRRPARVVEEVLNRPQHAVYIQMAQGTYQLELQRAQGETAYADARNMHVRRYIMIFMIEDGLITLGDLPSGPRVSEAERANVEWVRIALRGEIPPLADDEMPAESESDKMTRISGSTADALAREFRFNTTSPLSALTMILASNDESEATRATRSAAVIWWFEYHRNQIQAATDRPAARRATQTFLGNALRPFRTRVLSADGRTWNDERGHRDIGRRVLQIIDDILALDNVRGDENQESMIYGDVRWLRRSLADEPASPSDDDSHSLDGTIPPPGGRGTGTLAPLSEEQHSELRLIHGQMSQEEIDEFNTIMRDFFDGEEPPLGPLEQYPSELQHRLLTFARSHDHRRTALSEPELAELETRRSALSTQQRDGFKQIITNHHSNQPEGEGSIRDYPFDLQLELYNFVRVLAAERPPSEDRTLSGQNTPERNSQQQNSPEDQSQQQNSPQDHSQQHNPPQDHAQQQNSQDQSSQDRNSQDRNSEGQNSEGQASQEQSSQEHISQDHRPENGDGTGDQIEQTQGSYHDLVQRLNRCEEQRAAKEAEREALAQQLADCEENRRTFDAGGRSLNVRLNDCEASGRRQQTLIDRLRSRVNASEANEQAKDDQLQAMQAERDRLKQQLTTTEQERDQHKEVRTRLEAAEAEREVRERTRLEAIQARRERHDERRELWGDSNSDSSPTAPTDNIPTNRPPQGPIFRFRVEGSAIGHYTRNPDEPGATQATVDQLIQDFNGVSDDLGAAEQDVANITPQLQLLQGLERNGESRRYRIHPDGEEPGHGWQSADLNTLVNSLNDLIDAEQGSSQSQTECQVAHHADLEQQLDHANREGAAIARQLLDAQGTIDAMTQAIEDNNSAPKPVIYYDPSRKEYHRVKCSEDVQDGGEEMDLDALTNRLNGLQSNLENSRRNVQDAQQEIRRLQRELVDCRQAGIEPTCNVPEHANLQQERDEAVSGRDAANEFLEFAQSNLAQLRRVAPNAENMAHDIIRLERQLESARSDLIRCEETRSTEGCINANHATLHGQVQALQSERDSWRRAAEEAAESPQEGTCHVEAHADLVSERDRLRRRNAGLQNECWRLQEQQRGGCNNASNTCTCNAVENQRLQRQIDEIFRKMAEDRTANSRAYVAGDMNLQMDITELRRSIQELQRSADRGSECNIPAHRDLAAQRVRLQAAYNRLHDYTYRLQRDARALIDDLDHA